MDKQSIDKIAHEYYFTKEYLRLTDMWKKPLLKKQIRKQRRLENPVVPKEDEPTSSLYVHNAEKGIIVPALPN